MAQPPSRFPILHNQLFQVIVLSGAALLLLAFVILRYEGFFAMLRYLLCTVRPLLLGVLFASALNGPFQRFRQDFSRLATHFRRPPSERFVRGCALTATVLLSLLLVTGVVCILLPQLCASVRQFSENFHFYWDNLTRFVQRISGDWFPAWLSNLPWETPVSVLQDALPALLQKTYAYTSGFLTCVLDVGIGAVFSVYLLADQERLKRQGRVLAHRMLSPTRAAAVYRTTRMVCSTFARFLSSQLTEALILGVLCYAGMRLFHFSYPVLISVIIGITNMIPYVGPIVGTIPCLLVLLLVQPQMAPWFLLFVILLQQLESNLIYPRVVGHSIGLPPTWVLSAIVIGGGLWGIAGLLFGVPLTAVLYTLLFDKEQDSLE